MSEDRKFKGKLLFRGELELESPMLVGSGEDDVTDNDVIRDHEGKAYIPATSFVGVLRSEFIERNIDAGVFGYSNGDKSMQSLFYCKDLIPLSEAKINSRDGVRIDNKTGISVKGAKYDYEILERGAKFKFELGFDIDENVTKPKLKYDDAIKLINSIYTILNKHGITIGAKTQSGLGKVKLSRSELHKFDFRKKDDVENWLKDAPENKLEGELKENSSVDPKYNFELTGKFAIKNSLIVRSYRTNSKVTDAEHIKSNGKPVLPGTSLKGAIRARAEKILNTIKPEITEQILNNLFGFAGDGDDKAKSRILVEEREIIDTQRAVQSRVKIDRFTGGAIDGALFDSMPEFPTNEETNIELKFKIKKCEDHEAGLMLLLLKDLMTADLPIGGEKNVGRGVLIGKDAVLNYGQEFKFNSAGPVSNVDQLQFYIDELWKTKPEEKAKEKDHVK